MKLLTDHVVANDLLKMMEVMDIDKGTKVLHTRMMVNLPSSNLQTQ